MNRDSFLRRAIQKPGAPRVWAGALLAILLVAACRHTPPMQGAATACVPEGAARGSDAPSYAAGLPWFEAHEPLRAESPRDSYVKYGEARRINPGTLRRVGERHGVPIYAEPHPAGLPPPVLYVPVRPGCWFHPYQLVGVGEVRSSS